MAQALTQRSLEDARRNSQEQLRLTEQGQITERFTRAIDQLGASDDDGNPRLEVRLGGIYALERIDKESPERAYHATVMEVLTAYIRENSRRYHKESPPADIRAILDVLNRRGEDGVPEQHRVRLDLQGSYLRAADLQGADLQEVLLQRADLSEAILHGGSTNLHNANLSEADLSGADGSWASLQGANLSGANLSRANLIDANLQGATLTEAILHEADLHNADLSEVILHGAKLRDAKNLDQKQIEQAIGNLETILPKGLDRPQLWSRGNPEEQREILQERLRRS